MEKSKLHRQFCKYINLFSALLNSAVWVRGGHFMNLLAALVTFSIFAVLQINDKEKN